MVDGDYASSDPLKKRIQRDQMSSASRSGPDMEELRNASLIREIIPIPHKIGLLKKLSVFLAGIYELLLQIGDDKMARKLATLAVVREESIPQTIRHVVRAGFRLIPTNLDRLDFAGKNDVVTDVEKVSSGIFKIKTSDGMCFYDWPGSKKHKAMYWLMRDKSKSIYDPDTFFSGSAVYRSYLSGASRFPGDNYLPGEGGTIIEAGAYVGYKAIRFAKRVGVNGMILAIEANPASFGLLKNNIEENMMSSIVTPIHCAVTDKNKLMPLMSKARMKNTIVDTDELPFLESDMVEGKTLDSIIDEHPMEVIDFINLQLNGAELEALDGLQRHFNKVRYINIVSRHHRDGELVVDLARRMLEERGCTIVVDARSPRLYNLTAEVRA